MSKTNAFETAWNKYIFNDDDLTGIGDASGLQGTGGGSSANLYLALFILDPSEDDGSYGEVSYGGYARESIARGDASGFTCTTNNATNAATITWNTCTSGNQTASYIGIMADTTGGNMVYKGDLDTPISISTGVAPQILAGQLDINEN